MQELERADRMAERIQADKNNPYRRDISEFTADWKDKQSALSDLLTKSRPYMGF